MKALVGGAGGLIGSHPTDRPEKRLHRIFAILAGSNSDGRFGAAHPRKDLEQNKCLTCTANAHWLNLLLQCSPYWATLLNNALCFLYFQRFPLCAMWGIS